MSDIPKHYDPQATQAKWFPFWESHGHFNADPGTGKPPHTIMIPLPNVTGALHMGHALNGTCQDLITRWRRMQGYEALWMPGTDHAGIATQAVVERRLFEEEGLTRHDIGREALVERIWKWKDIYEKRIVSQQKSLGASCDWRRIRFTLDDVCAKAVRHTFFKMFRDGLIYRGKRLVNWDTFLQTAVADDEVFEEEIDGHFWTFNYPVVGLRAEGGGPRGKEEYIETGERIRFSTTRPETMLGDTAVCVHPSDERYAHLVGKSVRIPLNGRVIPIIADALLADPTKGTGAVKVTPGHDPNDYACYTRNPHIGVIDIMNLDGTLNENCLGTRDEGPGYDPPHTSPSTLDPRRFVGLDRLAARPLIVEEMERLGFYEGVEDRKIPMKHSDRSKTPIEPLRSDQWFVKMGPHTLPNGQPCDLAQSAIDAVKENRVRFYPNRYANSYLDWLGEKRDWCISRQLWWGHRIPVWSKVVDTSYLADSPDLEPGFVVELIESLGEVESSPRSITRTVDGPQATSKLRLICIEEGNPDLERKCEAAGYVQDPDVLDTWFSSALWPHATLGWPDVEHNPPLQERSAGEASGVRNQESAAAISTLDPRPSTNSVLATFYPHETPADGNHSVLITSRDIITLWVARMVLTGLYNMGDIPFRHVHVHPKILDGFGQTMSKSKGNGVDPVDLINKYGADAVRFTIASFAGETQDVKLPISYECPKCETLIPQTLKHQSAKPEGGPKPTVRCPKCKADYQYTTPNYDPDPGVPVARMVSERFEYGRNFCNKFWNAARFAMMNLEGYTPGEVTADQLQLEDRWILSRLSTVANQMNDFLTRYQFDAATRAIRDFTWNEFCDWYLEMIKPRLRRSEDREARSEERATAQRVLLAVLDSLVRLLQPFTPYICEELWQRLGEIAPTRALPPVGPSAVSGQRSAGEESGVRNQESAKRSTIAHQPSTASSSSILAPRSAEAAAIIAQWPTIPESWQDGNLEKRFERLQDTIIAVRNVRAIYNIPPGTPVKLLMRAAPEVAGDMRSVASQFDNLAKAVLEAAGAQVERPSGAASFSLGDADGFIPLEGLIDRQEELARQQKEAERIRKHIAGLEGRLNNENFVAKAAPQVVQEQRESLEANRKQLQRIEEIVRDLS